MNNEINSNDSLSYKESAFNVWKKYKNFIIIFILSIIVHLIIFVYQWINWGNSLNNSDQKSMKLIQAKLTMPSSVEKKIETVDEKKSTERKPETAPKEPISEPIQPKTTDEPAVDSRFQDELKKFNDQTNVAESSPSVLTQPKESSESTIEQQAKSSSSASEKTNDHQTDEHLATMKGIKLPKQNDPKKEKSQANHVDSKSESTSSKVAETKSQQQGIQMPLHLSLIYHVVKGDDDFTVGKATYDVKFEPQKRHYSIESKIETTGIFAVFTSGQLIQKSEGILSENGLKPIRFESTRLNKEQVKTEIIEFDWNYHKVYFKSNQDITKNADLPSGTQDMISLLYQFGFNRQIANSNVKVYLANTRSLESYSLTIKDNQRLLLNKKYYNVIYFQKNTAENGDKTEIWVSKDDKFIPIKIRQTDKKGTVMSFVIHNISELPN